MNLVSFCLYGNNPIYVSGLFRNLDSIQDKLPDYQAIVYVSRSCENSIIKEFASRGGIVRLEEEDWPPNGMFWRFNAIFEAGAKRVLIRDADSDISRREVAAIREWEISEKSFHIMRDHPLHTAPILGGMWGAKTKVAKTIFNPNQFHNYSKEKRKDQEYLSAIYSSVVGDALVHDAFFKFEKNSKCFSLPRKGYEFIGEPLDPFGKPQSMISRDLVKRAEASVLFRLKIRILFRFSMLLYRRRENL